VASPRARRVAGAHSLLLASARPAGHGASSLPRTTHERGYETLSSAHSHGPVVTGCRLPVTRASKLGVTGAQAEHIPFYLRTFLRVLSSWVHADQRISSAPPRESPQIQGEDPNTAGVHRELIAVCRILLNPRVAGATPAEGTSISGFSRGNSVDRARFWLQGQTPQGVPCVSAYPELTK